jgi:hypothetical protein
VRPAKTERNVAKEIDNFLQNVRVLKVAGMLGGFMKQFMEEQEEMKKDREQGSGVRDQGSGVTDLNSLQKIAWFSGTLMADTQMRRGRKAGEGLPDLV